MHGEGAGSDVGDALAVPDAGPPGVAFGEGQGGFDRCGVRRVQSPITSDQSHDRNRLWRAQGEVPSGAVLAAFVPPGAEGHMIREHPVKQLTETLGVNLPLQPESRCARSLPAARRGAALGVIVIRLIIT